MIRVWACVLTLVLPQTAFAQVTDDSGFTLTPELDLEIADDDELLGTVEAVEESKAATAEGAVLRGLDRVSGELVDIEMANGQSRSFERLAVTLGECRYPEGNPSSDAWAYLVVRDAGENRPSFEGWMVASSPALNALDHPRYDIWLLRCITSSPDGTE